VSEGTAGHHETRLRDHMMRCLCGRVKHLDVYESECLIFHGVQVTCVECWCSDSRVVPADN